MPGERYEPSARAPVPVPVPPPSAAAPASASPRTGTRGKALTVQVGRLRLSLLPIAGGVAAIVSSFLVWLDPPDPGRTADALDPPVTLKFLWDPFHADDGFKLGIVIIVLGALAAVLSAVPLMSQIRRLTGLLIGVLAVVYLVQLARLVDEVQGQSPNDVVDWTGPGPYVAVGAGLLIALGR